MKNASVIIAGHDNVGIIAEVSKILTRFGVNIRDISQTVMNDHFTMVILLDIDGCTIPMEELKEHLKELGDEMNLSVRMQLK